MIIRSIQSSRSYRVQPLLPLHFGAANTTLQHFSNLPASTPAGRWLVGIGLAAGLFATGAGTAEVGGNPKGGFFVVGRLGRRLRRALMIERPLDRAGVLEAAFRTAEDTGGIGFYWRGSHS